MKHIIIHSPYAESASQGNSVTAVRLENILTHAGYEVSHSEQDYLGGAADGMVALNARKSARAIAKFRYLHPDATLVIVLTGTDINHPDVIDESSWTSISLKLADHLIVLHDASLAFVPERFREKTSVIYPSVSLPDGLVHSPTSNDMIVSGNMRKEKNFKLAVEVSNNLPPSVSIHLYGKPSSPASGKIVEHGAVSHEEMLSVMARGRALLNTSTQEGGANAICEAIVLGLPVIASAIPGNIGMLGEDYAGLFPSNDAEALTAMLVRCVEDESFYQQLKQQVADRAPLFAHRQESEAWVNLLSL
ncbi:MAG: glycosyltransferase [Akkermansiaceae bacterium]